MSLFSKDINGRILDAGCGNKPYAHLFASSEYIGLEIDTPFSRAHKKADFFYDGVSFPFDESSFDNVISTQVLEHVPDANLFASEINRVLKNGGKLLLTVPFVWDEHEQPYDYARYSSYGIKHLLENNGFKIIEQRKTLSDSSIFFQLINAYLFKITIKFRRNRILDLFLTLLLMAPVNLAGLIAVKIFPRNEDLYLDNIVLCEKIADKW